MNTVWEHFKNKMNICENLLFKMVHRRDFSHSPLRKAVNNGLGPGSSQELYLKSFNPGNNSTQYRGSHLYLTIGKLISANRTPI